MYATSSDNVILDIPRENRCKQVIMDTRYFAGRPDVVTLQGGHSS